MAATFSGGPSPSAPEDEPMSATLPGGQDWPQKPPSALGSRPASGSRALPPRPERRPSQQGGGAGAPSEDAGESPPLGAQAASASRTGSRQSTPSQPPKPPGANVLKGGTLPRGADPLSALASQRQTPEAAPHTEKEGRSGKARKRDKEERTARSADATVARRNLEPELPQLPRATSLGASGHRRMPAPQPAAAMPPPRATASGWSSPGRDRDRVDGGELRQRAADVALTQNAAAKDREDSLLRMLDNRTKQRGVL